MAYLKKQLPEEALKESVLGRIAEAFQAEKEMNEKKEESKMWEMHEKMVSTAEYIPFTKFKKLFEKFLKGKGKILEVQDLKEEEYLIRFKLDKFKTSKILLFDIGKGAHGDYVKLPDFSLPEDMTTADKYRLCEELKNILEACLKENQESSENLEDMEEGELEQRIRNFLKGKKYSDLKTSLSGNNEGNDEGNDEFVRNENTLEPSYNIQFSSLSLDVWDNLKDGTIYEIYINQVGKGDKKEELIKLYRLLTDKIKS